MEDETEIAPNNNYYYLQLFQKVIAIIDITER